MCFAPHDHHRWVFCQREPRHKGKHAAVAGNPGQWTGNQPPGSWTTTWGDEFD